jgi:hypothetical protein
VDDGLRPSSVAGWAEFKNCSATEALAAVRKAALKCRTEEIPCFVNNYWSEGKAAVNAAPEAVEDSFGPYPTGR